MRQFLELVLLPFAAELVPRVLLVLVEVEPRLPALAFLPALESWTPPAPPPKYEGGDDWDEHEEYVLERQEERERWYDDVFSTPEKRYPIASLLRS